MAVTRMLNHSELFTSMCEKTGDGEVTQSPSRLRN